MTQLDESIKYIAIITDKMMILLKDLLKLSRAVKIDKPSEPIPLIDVINEAIELLTNQLINRT